MRVKTEKSSSRAMFSQTFVAVTETAYSFAIECSKLAKQSRSQARPMLLGVGLTDAQHSTPDVSSYDQAEVKQGRARAFVRVIL
jgi:hypothetical protein